MKVHLFTPAVSMLLKHLVNHEILFKRLLDKDLPSYLSRFLFSWYKDQCMCVRWADSFSNTFLVSITVFARVVFSHLYY